MKILFLILFIPLLVAAWYGNVDPETFELYIGWFAKDKSHCYLEGAVFKKANAETFKVLNWAF